MDKYLNNIFHISWNDGEIIYHPASGRIQNVSTLEVVRIEKNPQSQFPGFTNLSAEALIKQYQPFCLTVFTSHHCNLTCDYCYIQEKQILPSQHIDLAAVRAAAEIIANNCVDIGMPFILGFHGGNEPLLCLELVHSCIEICRGIASKYGLELLLFCTTNGVLSEKTATWAAQTFDGITLSWDGPAEIHDAHRVKTTGAPTSQTVKRSAEIFLKSSQGKAQFKVRTTVTSDSVVHLHKILSYFHEQNIKHVELYPAFQDSRNSLNSGLVPDEIKFASNFLKARNWAKKNDMNVGYAGSRLVDFHDKYCPILQNNLTLTPDGFLTACFKRSHNFNNQNSQFIYGRYNQGELIIDWPKLHNIFKTLSGCSEACKKCFNYLHCAKHCPNICPLQSESHYLDEYNCTLEKWVGLANILETAGYNLSDDVLDNCDVFFSNVVVKPIEADEVDYVQL